MQEYLTIEYAGAYGTSLQRARRLTDSEKSHLRPEYRDYMFVGIGDRINLKYIGWQDMPGRAPDGEFNGCSNRAYIITQSEYDDYIQLNAEREAAREARKREERRAMYLNIINMAQRQGGAMTADEARAARKRYNDLYNEGGEGFVPRYITVDELATAEAWLAENPD